MSNYGPISQTKSGDYEFVCENCGELFRTDSPEQLYCTNPCKRQAQNKRYYQKHREEIIEKVLARQREKKEKDNV